MINAIVGANGDMGRNLLVPLLQQLGETITADEKSSVAEWKAIWRADVIWLSIPRDEIPKVLAKVKLKPSQLIIDITSIKRRLSEIVSTTGAAHLSLHPLHGPFVPLEGQKWVLIKDEKNENNILVDTVVGFLSDKGINFLESSSEDEHDYMISLTLSMPEMLTLVMDELISSYAKECDQEKPSMKKMTEWAVPASNALLGFYIHSINSSADWLRYDLVCKAHGDLVASTKSAAARLTELTNEDVKKRLDLQRDFVEKLPLVERKRARQWIERWFVDSNQKMFSFQKNKQWTPKISIQYLPNKKDILSKNKTTIGIHGIAGSFSHESALRFLDEIGLEEKNVEFRYLVEADRVIKAVVDGEVDRGVFAFANSGSGAYVSSLLSMSQNDFHVLGIYGMEILQCLLANKSVKTISEIKSVFGHPQAVSQCKRTFEEKYPEIKLVSGEDSDDTALCAEKVANGDLPSDTATLASQTAAKIYGLNVLEYGMHHDPFNTTTFAFIKKKK